jgi:hypothetical protein
MTEYELFDLMGTWNTRAAISTFALVLLLTGYLLVAYFAGKNLPRSQTTLITCMMLWFSIMIISSLYTSLQTIIELREVASFAYTTIRRAIFFKWIITLGCLLTPLACIKFMYHVRHSRFE